MDKDKLLRLEGYIFKREGIASEEDIDYIEGKILDLLNSEGFSFCGTSRVEEND